MLNQSQTTSQKQQLKLSPQQIRLLELIQLNTLELDQTIRDELEENPALEIEQSSPEEESINPPSAEANEEYDDPFSILDQYHQDDAIFQYHSSGGQADKDGEKFEAPVAQKVNFREQLKDQLHVMSLDAQDRILADYIVDSLDDDGYLRHDLEDMADTFSFSHGIMVEAVQLENALEIVQGLEPVGIGARNLRECLLLQLESLPIQTNGVELACKVVDRHLNDLGNRNFSKIAQALNADTEPLRTALGVIARLAPKPVTGSVSELVENQSITPEFIVEKGENGALYVQLVNSNSPSLRLNSDLVDMLESMPRQLATSQQRAAAHYLHAKVSAAMWFMDAVRQRENSMLRTMQAIVQYQRDFFQNGDIQKLKPMVLKDIAEITRLDISTISRVTSTKYVDTDFGLVHLKRLFTTGLVKTDGQMASNKEIQDIIVDLVSAENKQEPITDQAIANILGAKGYCVARRTVAKYRDTLNIPAAKTRRVMP